MKILSKLLLTTLLTVLSGAWVFAQSPAGTAGETVVTFRFLPVDDMFFIRFGGNDAELSRLYSLADEYRAEITSGKMPVYVDGYCASLPTEKENMHTAFIRVNRVKSELITKKGLTEENFITKNYATAYTGSDGISHKDMVVVTLRIAAKAEQPDNARLERERREREAAERAAHEQEQRERAERERAERERAQAETDRAAKEQAERERAAAEQAEREHLALQAAPSKPYCFAVRTNLLYDAFLLPTLGVEWRISPSVGIKVDGSRSWWGDENGKVQKIWLVNPELRWYLLDAKQFYVGASANFGEYNIYKYMVGGLFSGDTGYQGKLWGAGLTVGYQLYLSRSFSLDFNLGLGYTNLEYDSFTMQNDTRVYKDKDKSKDFFGPTQAGISLIWTIGGNK